MKTALVLAFAALSLGQSALAQEYPAYVAECAEVAQGKFESIAEADGLKLISESVQVDSIDERFPFKYVWFTANAKSAEGSTVQLQPVMTQKAPFKKCF